MDGSPLPCPDISRVSPAYFKGGKTESSTRKVAINPEVGVAGDGNCTSGFLGLTNFFSSYFQKLCSTVMGKLQVHRLDGKKGSLKPVAWDDESRAAFEECKYALREDLQVF
jgi:hypothetical protein